MPVNERRLSLSEHWVWHVTSVMLKLLLQHSTFVWSVVRRFAPAFFAPAYCLRKLATVTGHHLTRDASQTKSPSLKFARIPIRTLATRHFPNLVRLLPDSSCLLQPQLALLLLCLLIMPRLAYQCVATCNCFAYQCYHNAINTTSLGC